MLSSSTIKRLGLPTILLCLLSALVLAGCGEVSQAGEGELPTPTLPLPAVDMAHAREAFEAGGELTYEEVVALKREIVGDYGEVRKIKDDAKFLEERAKYDAREREFATKVKECRLKETVGWAAWWFPEGDDNRVARAIPDTYRLAVYVYNPFDGFGKELRERPEMSLVYLTEQQIAPVKYGQRLRFSGDFLMAGVGEEIANVKLEMLPDEPPVPTPATDEMKDLRVTLDREVCYGTCPSYSVTIEADGSVTFEGRRYTGVTGTVTSRIDDSKLEELATEVKKADFFSLDTSYSAEATDLPTYVLTVRMSGRSKEVSSYATRPRRLAILMDRIDQIVNTAQWMPDNQSPEIRR